LFLAAYSCVPGEGGCLGETESSPTLEELPEAPDVLDETARLQADDLDLSVDEWSDEVINSMLEGTGVSAGSNVEGDASSLEGSWTVTLVDEETGVEQRTQLIFDSDGEVTEIQLFADDLTEAAALTFDDPEAAKVTVRGRLLGALVRALGSGRFEVLVVVVVDRTVDDLVVRTRRIFQLLLALTPDENALSGAGRRTIEVIASAQPDSVPGELTVSSGSSELNRNATPVANAGEDQMIVDLDADGVETVRLDGSASFDPDGEIVRFVWLVDGETVLEGPIVDVNLAVGPHAVLLAVVDDLSAQAVDGAAVVIEPSGGSLSIDAPAPLNTNADTDTGIDDETQILWLGLEKWGAVWASTENLGGTIGTDLDVLVSLSTDNGVTWGPPAPLVAAAETDSGTDNEPQIATDGTGKSVATWFSTDTLGDTIDTDFDILVSADAGGGFDPPKALNTNANNDFGSDLGVDLATDTLGKWVAVWSSVSDLAGGESNDSDLLVSVSTDDGATWDDPPAFLNSNHGVDSGNDITPTIATDSAGKWIAAWNSRDDLGSAIGTDADILFSFSDDGTAWSDPTFLNSAAETDAGADLSPQLAVDKNAGRWIAVWGSTEDLAGTGTDFDLLYAISEDGNTWSNASPLNTNATSDSGADQRPHIAFGGGVWACVWQSTDSRNGTLGIDLDILVSVSDDNGQTWSDPQPLNTNAATDDQNDSRAHIATNGLGDWRAVWTSTEDLGGTIGTDSDILFAGFKFP
jgi:hypothetical protein